MVLERGLGQENGVRQDIKLIIVGQERDVRKKIKKERAVRKEFGEWNFPRSEDV